MLNFRTAVYFLRRLAGRACVAWDGFLVQLRTASLFLKGSQKNNSQIVLATFCENSSAYEGLSLIFFHKFQEGAWSFLVYNTS